MTYSHDNSLGFLWIFGVVYLVALGLALAFALAYWALLSFALSRFFAKVGVEPWTAWVPIYQYWKWLEVGGFMGSISLLYLIPGARIAASVCLFIGMYRSGIAFKKDPAFLILGIFLPFVWAFILSGESETYEPELISKAGYPAPLAGFGSVERQQPST
jgi:hypothetical protein